MSSIIIDPFRFGTTSVLRPRWIWGASSVNVNYTINVVEDPSVNNDVWVMLWLGQLDGLPTNMTFDGMSPDTIDIQKYGSFDVGIIATYENISGTGNKNTNITGLTGVNYRSTITGFQLRNADMASLQTQWNGAITTPGNLSLTPVKDGAFAAGMYTVRDSAAATVGGTLVSGGSETKPEGVVEADFRTQGHNHSGLTASVAETYTFAESVGTDDRTMGMMVLVDPV